jgi:hypothetical protein
MIGWGVLFDEPAALIGSFCLDGRQKPGPDVKPCHRFKPLIMPSPKPHDSFRNTTIASDEKTLMILEPNLESQRS